MSKLPSPFVPNDTDARIRAINQARQRPPIASAHVPKRAVIAYLNDPRTGMLVALYKGRIVTP